MRNYGQYCPVARGSEILAERWTPIILRNILLGCSTFNAISDGAPGLSRSLLARRLRDLDRAGVICVTPKPDGHGSLYEATPAGRGLWPVLQALGDWAEQWSDLAQEHSDPAAVLWSWCQSYVRHDLLPEHRVVVRFEFAAVRGASPLWLLFENGEGEVCAFDPEFGDDLVVEVRDRHVFARWHLGIVDWGSALSARAVVVSGPESLRRALPAWNAAPEIFTRKRLQHQRTGGGRTLLPIEAKNTEPPRSVPGTWFTDRGLGIPDFEGPVVRADHDQYDELRAVWNGLVDRRPAIIARCLSDADVRAVVRFAREQEQPASVRAGGHSVSGASVRDDGIVIDLSTMKRIEVDPVARTARAQAGVVWGELDAATQALGFATTGGTVSHTGVSGLTLGGGIGWLMRRHGLTVDNLLQARVVTAEAEQLVASPEEHDELFWGLRGGGPGLGIATEFTFRLHPVGPEVLAGQMMWSLEDAGEVLRAYRDFTERAPDEVASIVTLRRVPRSAELPVELHGRPVCAIGMLALADMPAAERMLAPMRSQGRPLLDLVRLRPYTNLQSMSDAHVPHGWHYHWKSAGLVTLTDAAIDGLVEHTSRASSPWSFTLMFQLGGAVAEADAIGTAYNRRHVGFEVISNAAWLPHDTVGEHERSWARELLTALDATAPGAYLNFLDHDERDREQEAFDESARRRLAELRRQYDPGGLLRDC
jgi:FAD/FMN-containing dehydrogenase/DNA-binding HxlR family transcriptional regulator